MTARYVTSPDGSGDPIYHLMRCTSCRKLVTPKMIKSGSCRCGARKMKATNPVGIIERVCVYWNPKKYGVGGLG